MTIAVRIVIVRDAEHSSGFLMAAKYDPEKDYTRYLELAKEREELLKAIAELIEEDRKLQEKIEKHKEAARELVTNDLIQTAAHEFQVEILNAITQAVMDSGDLQKAVRLIDRLETHLEARLRLSLKEEDTRREAPPTVSPAIAARKQEAPKTQPEKVQQSGKEAPPPPTSGSSSAAGKIVERRNMVNDEISEICRYEYDGERLSRLVFFDAASRPLRTHQMIYDRDGNLVQEIHIDRSGVTLQVFDRELDKNGRIAKEITRNSQNEIISTVEFVYDRKGRLAKKQWKDARGNKTKSWEYRFDRDAKEPEKIIWRDERNKPYGFVELKYDDKGHILSEISKDRSGDVIRSQTYQYFYG